MHNHVPLLLAGLFLLGGLLTAMPVNAEDTGIRGSVLWGPVEPGPAQAGRSDEAPLRASFIVLGSGRKVARFESDDEGNFEVLLAPGEYTIVPDKSTPIPFPERQQQAVIVPDEGFAVVTLRFDTGMR